MDCSEQYIGGNHETLQYQILSGWIFEGGKGLRLGGGYSSRDIFIHFPSPTLSILRCSPALPVPLSAVCELWGGQMMVYENSFSGRGTMFVLWCWRHENLKLAGISEIKAPKLLKDKALLRFEDGEVFGTDSAAPQLPSLANFKQEPSGTLIETINETHFKTTFNFKNFENHNITNYENWIRNTRIRNECWKCFSVTLNILKGKYANISLKVQIYSALHIA